MWMKLIILVKLQLWESRDTILSVHSVASTFMMHDSILYTNEYLNSLNLGGGYPPHCLDLKENAPITLLS